MFRRDGPIPRVFYSDYCAVLDGIVQADMHLGHYFDEVVLRWTILNRSRFRSGRDSARLAG